MLVNEKFKKIQVWQSYVNFNLSYLGIVPDTELSDDKHIQRQERYQYCAARKLQAFFSNVQMQ